MKIWLVSPAWGRYEVTELALAERRWLCDVLASRGWTADSVIVGNDENLDIAQKYGFSTVRMGNEFLGKKFNAGYQYAGDQGADICVHIGSDDWLHPDAFNFLRHIDLNEIVKGPRTHEIGKGSIWSTGPTVMSQRHLTLVDLTRGVGRRCQVRGRFGCIPWFVPRVALESCAFAPIEPQLARGIDGSLTRGILPSNPNWEFQEDSNPLWLVDWKSDQNLTTYRSIADTLGMTEEDEEPWHLLAQKYPVELVEKAKALSA